MTTGFVDRVQTKLTEGVTNTATLLPCWGGDLAQFRPGGVDVYAVIRNAEHAEVVKVTGIQPFTGLVVERGQDGSTPRAFAAGSIVSVRLVEGALENCQQKGVMRQVAYNPNAVLMPAYFGEKVAETGVDGCVRRVWQNVLPLKMSWRIVYGEMCKSFVNWRDWNWELVNLPPWNWLYQPGKYPLFWLDAGDLETEGDITTWTDKLGQVAEAFTTADQYGVATVQKEGDAVVLFAHSEL